MHVWMHWSREVCVGARFLGMCFHDCVDMTLLKKTHQFTASLAFVLCRVILQYFIFVGCSVIDSRMVFVTVLCCCCCGAGFNCAEAVNFATEQWVSSDACQCCHCTCPWLFVCFLVLCSMHVSTLIGYSQQCFCALCEYGSITTWWFVCVPLYRWVTMCTAVCDYAIIKLCCAVCGCQHRFVCVCVFRRIFCIVCLWLCECFHFHFGKNSWIDTGRRARLCVCRPDHVYINIEELLKKLVKRTGRTFRCAPLPPDSDGGSGEGSDSDGCVCLCLYGSICYDCLCLLLMYDSVCVYDCGWVWLQRNVYRIIVCENTVETVHLCVLYSCIIICVSVCVHVFVCVSMIVWVTVRELRACSWNCMLAHDFCWLLCV